MHILGIILLCVIYSLPIIAVLLADSRIGREAGVKLNQVDPVASLGPQASPSRLSFVHLGPWLRPEASVRRAERLRPEASPCLGIKKTGLGCGVEQQVARVAHNHKVPGSNPGPAI